MDGSGRGECLNELNSRISRDYLDKWVTGARDLVESLRYVILCIFRETQTLGTQTQGIRSAMPPTETQPTVVVSAACGTEITLNIGGQRVLFKSGAADEPEKDLPKIPPRRGKDPDLRPMMKSFDGLLDILGDTQEEKDKPIELASGDTIPEAFFENLSDDVQSEPIVVRVRNKDNG